MKYLGTLGKHPKWALVWGGVCVQILWLHWEFVIPVLHHRAVVVSWTFFLNGYFQENYICGNRVNLYFKASVIEANNSVILGKKRTVSFRVWRASTWSFHIPIWQERMKIFCKANKVNQFQCVFNYKQNTKHCFQLKKWFFYPQWPFRSTF